MLAILLFIIVLIYLLLIGWLNFGFNKVYHFKLQDLNAKTKFSIIIPFRNEAEHLPNLIKTILNLNYSNHLFEVIFVDDESSDHSLELIQKNLKNSILHFKVIANKRKSNSPKKDAISSAIAVAKHNWVITTDADCFLPKYWLDCYDEFIQLHDTNCIAGPVKFIGASSFFNRFQIMDTLSLQSATIGGFGLKKPFMCNGANFAYTVSEFKKIGGFNDNNKIASGDDVFLLERFLKQDKSKVQYLKSSNAIVATQVTKTFKELVQQRLRWASKTTNYTSWFAKIVGLITLACNLVCVALITLVVFQVISTKTAVLLFIIKFCIDLLLLFKTARFFKQEPVLLSYVFASLLYPFFSSYIAVTSMFTSYKWKGRTFKK